MFCYVVGHMKKYLSEFIWFVRFKDPFNAIKGRCKWAYVTRCMDSWARWHRKRCQSSSVPSRFNAVLAKKDFRHWYGIQRYRKNTEGIFLRFLITFFLLTRELCLIVYATENKLYPSAPIGCSFCELSVRKAFIPFYFQMIFTANFDDMTKFN